ncbi:hypothetical protein ACWEOO_40240 [Kribbella sp. NPDC004138]
MLNQRVACRVGFLDGHAFRTPVCRFRITSGFRTPVGQFRITRRVVRWRLFVGVRTLRGSRRAGRLACLWSRHGCPLLTAYRHTTQLVTKRRARRTPRQAISDSNTCSLRTHTLFANVLRMLNLLARTLLAHILLVRAWVVRARVVAARLGLFAWGSVVRGLFAGGLSRVGLFVCGPVVGGWGGGGEVQVSDDGGLAVRSCLLPGGVEHYRQVVGARCVWAAYGDRRVVWACGWRVRIGVLPR